MEVRGFKRFNNQPIDKGVIMKKSISVVFALSFLISFPVSALAESKGAYLRRCSIWINGSRVEVFTCIGSRDERGRVNYIEWDTPEHGGRAMSGYTIWQPGRTKDCFVHYKDRNYAICLYD